MCHRFRGIHTIEHDVVVRRLRRTLCRRSCRSRINPLGEYVIDRIRQRPNKPGRYVEVLASSVWDGE